MAAQSNGASKQLNPIDYFSLKKKCKIGHYHEGKVHHRNMHVRAARFNRQRSIKEMLL
jgi:hypothetical protein